MKKYLFLIPILYISGLQAAPIHHLCTDKEGRELVLMMDGSSAAFVMQGTTGFHAGTLSKAKDGTFKGINKASQGLLSSYTLNHTPRSGGESEAVFTIEPEGRGDTKTYPYQCKNQTAEMQKSFAELTKK